MKQLVVLAFVVLLASCENDERIKGDVLYNDGNYKAAVEAYNEYIGLHPSHVKSIYNRGRSYEELKKYDKAFDDFTQVLDIDKKNTSAMLSLSKHYYRESKFDKAKYFGEAAVKINDQLPSAHFWLGRAHHQLGMFNKALVSYNNAINLDRELGEAYLYRGAIKMKSSSKKSACSDFLSAKKLGVKEAEVAVRKYCN